MDDWTIGDGDTGLDVNRDGGGMGICLIGVDSSGSWSRGEDSCDNGSGKVDNASGGEKGGSSNSGAGKGGEIEWDPEVGVEGWEAALGSKGA